MMRAFAIIYLLVPFLAVIAATLHADKVLRRAAVSAAIATASILPVHPPFVKAETEVAAPEIVKLSASDLRKVDIEPKLDVLKDVLFILRLLPTYVSSQDYTSLRQSLREGPSIELRKTCKKLEKYMPEKELG